MSKLTITLLVIVIYVAIMVIMSVSASRKNAKNKTVKEFTTAGGTMGWLLIASAMFGTCTSSAATIGAANTFYNMGWTAIHYGISRALPFILMGFIGIEKIRHFKAINPGDMFATVFQKKDDYIYGIMFSFVLIGLCGSCILGSISVLRMFFPAMSKWVAGAIVAFLFWIVAFLGGMRGANNTGLFNTIVIILGMVVVMLVALPKAGGLAGINEAIAGTTMASLFNGQPLKTTIGWYAASIIEAWAAANVWLQIHSAKRDTDVKIGFSLSGVIALAVAFVVGIIGLIAYKLFSELPTSGAMLAVAEECGPLIAAILAVAIIAAVASTAVQFYVAAPAVLYRSIAAISGKQLDEKGEYRLLKGLTVVVAIAGFAIAMLASDLITLATTIITINTPYAILIMCVLRRAKFLRKSTFRVVSITTVATLLACLLIPSVSAFFGNQTIYPATIGCILAIIACVIFDKRPATIEDAFKDEYRLAPANHVEQ